MGIFLAVILGIGNLFSKEKESIAEVQPPWKEIRGELKFANDANPILIENAKIPPPSL